MLQVECQGGRFAAGTSFVVGYFGCSVAEHLRAIWKRRWRKETPCAHMTPVSYSCAMRRSLQLHHLILPSLCDGVCSLALLIFHLLLCSCWYSCSVALADCSSSFPTYTRGQLCAVATQARYVVVLVLLVLMWLPSRPSITLGTGPVQAISYKSLGGAITPPV